MQHIICHVAHLLLITYYQKKNINNRYTLIKNAVQFSEFEYSKINREEVRSKLGFEEKIVLGTVGRLSKEKNQVFMIEILKRLIEMSENYRLVIVGEGNEINNLLNKIKEYNLQEYIVLYGSSSSPGKLLSAIDVFLLSSHREGFGLSAIEAQISGIPTLVSNNISNEVAISDNIYFLNLDLMLWVKSISELDFNRKPLTEKSLSKKGFNILIEAQKLEQIYINLSNG